jgi:hypothetical protein
LVETGSVCWFVVIVVKGGCCCVERESYTDVAVLKGKVTTLVLKGEKIAQDSKGRMNHSLTKVCI